MRRAGWGRLAAAHELFDESYSVEEFLLRLAAYVAVSPPAATIARTARAYLHDAEADEVALRAALRDASARCPVPRHLARSPSVSGVGSRELMSVLAAIGGFRSAKVAVALVIRECRRCLRAQRHGDGAAFGWSDDDDDDDGGGGGGGGGSDGSWDDNSDHGGDGGDRGDGGIDDGGGGGDCDGDGVDDPGCDGDNGDDEREEEGDDDCGGGGDDCDGQGGDGDCVGQCFDDHGCGGDDGDDEREEEGDGDCGGGGGVLRRDGGLRRRPRQNDAENVDAGVGGGGGGESDDWRAKGRLRQRPRRRWLCGIIQARSEIDEDTAPARPLLRSLIRSRDCAFKV